MSRPEPWRLFQFEGPTNKGHSSTFRFQSIDVIRRDSSTFTILVDTPHLFVRQYESGFMSGFQVFIHEDLIDE